MAGASRTIKNDEGLFLRQLDLTLFNTVVGNQNTVVYGLNLDDVEFNKPELRELLKKVTGGYVPVITMKFFADWKNWNLADSAAMADKVFPQRITLEISNTHKAKPWRKVDLAPHPYKQSLMSISMRVDSPFEAPKNSMFDVEKARMAMELHKASQKTFDVALDSIDKVFYGWAFTADQFAKLGKAWIHIEEIADTAAPITEAELTEIETKGKTAASQEKAEVAEMMKKLEPKEKKAE